jgi:hypothetical protein
MKKITFILILLMAVPAVLAINPSTYENFDYEHGVAAYSAYFRNNTNTGHPIRIEHAGYFFEYDISGSNLQYHGKPGQPAVTDTLGGGASSNTLDTQLRYSGDTIYYDDAFSYTNITYELMDTQIKETFILQQIPNLKTEYDYLEYTGHVYFNRSLQICDDLKCYVPSGTEDNFNTTGKIYFKSISNYSNETQFMLKEPIIRDSAGQETRGIYFVYGSDAQMRFDLRIPVSWLATASYPVYIDPTYDVTGCTENSTHIYCNSTMTGTYIHTDKIIDIDGASWSHAFSISGDNYVWINSSTKVIIRNNANIDMYGNQINTDPANIWLVVRAPDVDISGGSTILHTHGGAAAWPSSNPSGAGAGSAYIQIDAVNLTFRDGLISTQGGSGYSSDGNNGHGPGAGTILIYSPNINISNSAMISSTAGSHGGECTHGEGGGSAYVYLYPYNSLFSGYGYSGKNKAIVRDSTITSQAGAGSGSGCSNGYARMEIWSGQEFYSYSSTINVNSYTGIYALYGHFKMYNFDTIYFEKSKISLPNLLTGYSNITFNGTDAKLGLFNTTQSLPYIGVNSINDNNLTLGWYTVNDYENFTIVPSYINKTFIEFFNDIPNFNQTPVNFTIHHNDTITYDLNCSDDEGDNITYFTNSTLFTINDSTGVFSDDPTIAEAGVYKIQLICGDALGNNTATITYTIINDAPGYSGLALLPTQNDGSLNLYLNFTAYDNESDAIYNYTQWYKNNVYNSSWDNLTILPEEYFNDGDTIKVTFSLTDLYAYSPAINLSVAMNDTLPPFINRLYPSTTSPYTTSVVTFYVNVTDIASEINSNACKFTLRKSDYNGGTGVGNSWNETTNTKSGDILSFSLSMTALGTGVLEWQKAYCSDVVPNTAINSSVGINITISTQPVTPPSQPGGGGTSFSTIGVIEGTSTDVRVAPTEMTIIGVRGNKYIKEFQVFNLGTDKTFIDIYRDDKTSSIETVGIMYFVVGGIKSDALSNYIIDAPLTLATQTQYVQFYLEIPDDMKIGDYIIKYNIVDDSNVNTPLTINLQVRDSLFDITLFDVPTLVTNSTSGELQLQFKPLSLGLSLLIAFVLVILIGGVWIVIKSKRT